jgi:LPXTG-motif cell wall-anchored protein
LIVKTVTGLLGFTREPLSLRILKTFQTTLSTTPVSGFGHAVCGADFGMGYIARLNITSIHFGVHMTRRLGTAVGATLAAGVLSLAAALPAAAEDAVAGDARATAYAGNATTCAHADLDGEIIAQGGQGGQTMDVTVPEGITLTGIVIKGGPNYNVYPGNVLTDLHSPLVESGNIPQISHWFVCGTKSGETSGEVSVDIDEAAAPMAEESGNAANTGTGDGAVAGAEAAGGAEADGEVAAAEADDELAATGFSATIPLVVGGALLLIGGGLLVYLRRTRKQED